MITHLTSRLSLIAAIAVALAVSAPARSVQDAAVFAQELQRAQAKMKDSNWESARVQLERALEAHKGQAYVLGHLGEIELILKRCAYWEQTGELDVAKLFKGEVVSYNAAAGKIQLRYEEGRPHDFEQRGMALVHAIDFSGPYTIEQTGVENASLVVCATPTTSIQVGFSRTYDIGHNPNKTRSPIQRKCSFVIRLPDENGQEVTTEEIAEFTTRPTAKNYKLKFAVTASHVTAYFNGKSQHSVAKPADLWGTLALPLGTPSGTILVEGDASAFFERKRDEIFRGEWKDFERNWNLHAHLPPWLISSLGTPTTPQDAKGTGAGLEASQLTQDQIRVWNAAVQALNGGEYTEVIAKTDQLLGMEPNVASARFLQAQAYVALRQKEKAIESLAPCATSFPAYQDGMSYLVRLLLVSGRFEEVLDAVSKGIVAGLHPSVFQLISVTANKAIHGPAWNKKYTYESRHYRVASDISEARCREVAVELEETFRHISRRMRAGEARSDRKFQVYAFSGQSSYLDYIEDVFEGRGEFTQGMYSAYLKQLLVLDSEPRDSFRHTVRHEGFHQFFDSILDEPPIWLNEGLAEYFASARTPEGAWQDGRLNETRLAHLRRPTGSGLPFWKEMVPIATFLEITHEEFMANGPNNYAQAWALVHYLRHSTVDNKERFAKLLAGLLGGQTNEVATREALKGLDLEMLDREFAAFVGRL